MDTYTLSSDNIFTVISKGHACLVVFAVLGKHFIFDSCSLNLIEIDELTSEVARSEMFWNKREICLAIQNKYADICIKKSTSGLCCLESSGVIFSDDLYLETEASVDTFCKTLCIIVTEYCNQSCIYCFEDDFFRKRRRVINVCDVIMMFDKFVEQNIKQYNVVFFGGEPTLRFDVIKEVIDYISQYAKEKGFKVSFTITTNGTLLDNDMLNFIEANQVKLIVSLDGPEGVHNSQRFLKNNANAYKMTVNTLQAIVNKRLEVLTQIRATYTNRTISTIVESVAHIVELGFSNISIEPAFLNMTNSLAINGCHYDELKKEYDKLASWLHEQASRNNNVSIFQLERLKGIIQNKIFRRFECSAGKHFLALTPNGDISPCDVTAGMSGFILGNINTGIDQNKQNQWNGDVNSKIICKACWIKYVCGGGCRAWAISYNGDINTPYEFNCFFVKMLFSYAAWLLSINNRVDK